MARLPGVQVRTHQTTLYASQFRFDDSMLVNNHTYGSWAAQSPVLHCAAFPAGNCSATTTAPSNKSGRQVNQ